MTAFLFSAGIGIHPQEGSMEKTIHRSGKRISKALALFLAALIPLTVLPVSSVLADKCPEDGGHCGPIVDIWPIDWHYHAWICGNCGETVKESHWIYGGYPDPDRYHCVDSQTHYFLCGCGYKTYETHSFYNGECICGYREGSQTGTTESSGTTSSNSSGSNKNSQTSTVKVLPTKPGKYAISACCSIGGEKQNVQIAILGLCRSYVFVDDAPMYVNTEDLEIAEGVEREERLAFIQASGHARLYKEPEFKRSRALVDPGTILPVLSVGDNYIEVMYQGKTGYLKRSSVELRAPCEGLGTGLVENGKKTVNIRLEKSMNSKQVTAVRSGTEITLLSESDNWYEVEYFGLHGYIRKEFITVTGYGFGEEAKPEKESAKKQTASAGSTKTTASTKQEETEASGATTEETAEENAEEPEEGSLIFRDDHITLSLTDAAMEDGTVQTKIRAAASDCVCYLFAFTSTEITDGNTDFYVIKNYVDTMNGTFWDAVSSEPEDFVYQWDDGISYESPFINAYAESMKTDYQTIGCTLSDSRITQPIGFTVIEAKEELDADGLLEGRITLDSVRDDLIHAFHLYISPP